MLPGRVRNKLDASLNRLRAKLDVGDYWCWLDAEDVEGEIDIHALVFPLRYDIQIRKVFFEYYAEHRDMYREYPSAFLQSVKQHPYYEWFKKVLVVRYEAQLKNDPGPAQDKAFAVRVQHPQNYMIQWSATVLTAAVRLSPIQASRFCRLILAG